MKRLLLCVGATSIFALTFLPVVRAEVAQDEQGRTVLVSSDSAGRVTNRTVLEADGSRHVTATEYWEKGKVARRMVDEDRDPDGRATRRTLSTFDNRGRVIESSAVTIDAAGQERGTRTRYSYDVEGQPSKTTSRIGR